jgi:hypothetical protein
LVGELR